MEGDRPGLAGWGRGVHLQAHALAVEGVDRARVADVHRLLAERRHERGGLRRAEPARHVIAGTGGVQARGVAVRREVVVARGDVVEVGRLRLARERVELGLAKPISVPWQSRLASASANNAAQTGAAPLVPPVPCQPDSPCARMSSPFQ